MLAKRIIPCLDVTGGRVVKGVNFVELRDAGDPVEIAARYNEQGADELTFLDITATSDGRDLILHIIEAVASQVFIPLTVGGGVRTVADVRRLLKHEAPILFPDITYSFYPVYCGLYGVDFRTVPLADDFSINSADYCGQPEKTAKNEIGGIIFPNPNAPTGRLLGLAAIEQILQANPDVVVVVDEAYVDFGGETAITLVDRYDNLLVVHTLSKSRSLAGLRVGFAVGHPALIEALERVKNSFNSYPLDRLAIVGAVAAMEDEAYFEQCCRAVIATRDTLTVDLCNLGFEVLPSAANFIFARHPQRDAAELAKALREQSIIVRHFKLPRIDQFLRITVGTEAECKALTQTLQGILA